ncbi:unnamed protein product [Caenorhabditis auriculariae]|uniref:Uncharacterized protein n=1 Tax=Caenorhabditis auriculariae TaxID=2777116 RepID=A0A8S1HT61_9PELO|nr:unnamed protein product [Caenorhabditis auriculariae]
MLGNVRVYRGPACASGRAAHGPTLAQACSHAEQVSQRVYPLPAAWSSFYQITRKVVYGTNMFGDHQEDFEDFISTDEEEEPEDVMIKKIEGDGDTVEEDSEETPVVDQITDDSSQGSLLQSSFLPIFGQSEFETIQAGISKIKNLDLGPKKMKLKIKVKSVVSNVKKVVPKSSPKLKVKTSFKMPKVDGSFFKNLLKGFLDFLKAVGSAMKSRG